MASLPIALVVPADDPLNGRPPVRSALDRLHEALIGKDVRVLSGARATDDRVAARLLVAGPATPSTWRVLAHAGISIPAVPESLGLVPDGSADHPAVLVTGTDERGLVYALLELADRVTHAAEPLDALRIEEPIVERPANQIRSVGRIFASEIEDKPWFLDEEFWRRYLSMVISHRFNRFSLMLGAGYNAPWGVTDSYLYFAYPFLVDLPEYGVRVPQLTERERDRNLAMLRFISEETVARGLDFQLGIWAHNYVLTDSPDARYTVEGLTPDRHAAYCRDALQLLLESCPAIGGLTLRIHAESGIAERNWDFWRTVIDGIARCGRPVGIDLHAKGLDEPTLDIARATGLPLTVSPKYWAEHMGLPYQQASIRANERPPGRSDRPPSDMKQSRAVSEGTRSFTRYGYGDFLREDRDYDVVFRMWPGTQRLLLWGDPATAAGFGRHASFAGTQGLEWCEPLGLKGRQGSGLPGSRDGYADASLSANDDWEKYEYTYRLFGRLTYNPDADPETWRRSLRTRFGRAAADAEAALASASRILPLVTTAHHPSASNNYYWPEIYTDMPIVAPEGSPESYYYDTPVPKRFGTVSSLDPEIFSSPKEFVAEALADAPSGRYSPLQVAGWLEGLSAEAAEHLARMETELADPADPEARRLIVDVAIQEALGRFFAGKMRASVLVEVAERTGQPDVLVEALATYRAARDAWVNAADRASGVYVDDLTFGPEPYLRGTWADRLPAIDRDLDDLSELVTSRSAPAREPAASAAIAVGTDPGSDAVAVAHRPPASFRPGEDLTVTVDASERDGSVVEVRLRYRAVDQSQGYEEITMTRDGGRFMATIPASASDTPYALQYFFVVRDDRGHARLHPGFDPDLSNQPYYVVRQA